MPKQRLSKTEYKDQQDTDRITRQAAFLDAYAACGNISAACKALGISRQTEHMWRKLPEYRKLFMDAHEAAADALEAEARRRAVDGVSKLVLYKGEPVKVKNPKTGEETYLTTKEFSDVLLIFLLKGVRPEKYRERYEHSGPQGGPIQNDVKLDLSKIPSELLRSFRDALRSAGPSIEGPHAGGIAIPKPRRG